jgi:hypothetical protein
MPDWTKKSFDDLRDVSPRDLPMQWRFARGDTERFEEFWN